MTRAASWVLAVGIVAGCGFCGWAGYRTWRASADLNRGESLALTGGGAVAAPYLALAARYRPDEARVWRLRARFAAFDDARRARAFARRAVNADPMDWRNWDRLGIIEFQLGDAAAARRALRNAVRFDRGWEAHYRLGNLALLLGDGSEYWSQMKAALRMVASARAWPVLQEALSVAGGRPERLVSALPRRRARVDGQAIVALLNAQRALAAVEVWRRMLCPAYEGAICRAAALRLANALANLALQAQGSGASALAEIGTGVKRSRERSGELIRQAVDTWNEAVRRGLLQASPVVRDGEVGDGGFRGPWVGPAFAWARAGAVAIGVERGAAPGGNAARIGFDGYEPQNTPLLQQLVPVDPGAEYEVSFLSRREGEGAQAGVVLDVEAGRPRPLLQLAATLRVRWRRSRAGFSVPRGVHVICLCFVYQRPMGQVRLHNPVLIAGVRLRRSGP